MTTQKYPLYWLGRQLMSIPTRVWRSNIRHQHFTEAANIQYRAIPTERSHKKPHVEMLASMIATGWPETKQEVPLKSLPYWYCHNKLSICNDIIFKGEKVIIMQGEMQHNIHSLHLGADKSKRRWIVMFWPEMASQIQDTVANCHICSTNQWNNAKEPMIAHEIPIRPWSQVGLKSTTRSTYLVIFDYYSGFIEINPLQNGTTSKRIIIAVLQLLSTRLTDNRQWATISSTIFKQFSQQYGF